MDASESEQFDVDCPLVDAVLGFTPLFNLLGDVFEPEFTEEPEESQGGVCFR